MDCLICEPFYKMCVIYVALNGNPFMTARYDDEKPLFPLLKIKNRQNLSLKPLDRNE